ncbi:hypothetical protein E2C01_080495 [Portunus trituberculatus]|uniref:Uncharacterized protein n=1 Tax=Portunus trituberculatus TaxID=210409 RepID=A0A5B7IMD7_PORTR|nr:hypothetical protein [Portunus trituberculatus]
MNGGWCFACLELRPVVAGPEDTPETLSFYSEPIMASLSNIITPPDEKEKEKGTSLSKDYTFLEVELKYGILQVRSLDESYNRGADVLF